MKKLFTLLTLLLCVASSAWADAEIIYSMTAVTGPTGNIDSGTTVDISATFVGGSAQAKNGKSSAAALVSGSDINLGGSGNSYFHATLTSGTIAEGDIITLSASGTMYVSATDTKGSSVTFPYTVPSGSDLIGKTHVYLWKNGVSKFSSFTITRPSADDVANPVIEQDGSNVTITCSTSGASVYYTTDGSEPTSNSTEYSAAFTIDNSCTVRAIAIKGEKTSSIIIKDCYVSHSSALAVLGYSGGSVSGDVWTSIDGNFILTNNVETRGIGYVNLAVSQDGFKLNHTDNYTLQVGQDIKVTKIVVVGKSWLKGSAGNATTLAFDGFTPASGTFFDYVDETYVKTIEFVPESELEYGATITMRPGNNQLGAYIEIYGVKRSGPADPENMILVATISKDTGTLASNTWKMTDNNDYTFSASSLTWKNDTDFKIVGNGTYTIGVPSDVTVSRIDINGYSASKDGTTVTLSNNESYLFKTAEVHSFTPTHNAGESIVFTTSVKEMEITYIKLYAANGLTLTTTSTMQGWRAFYDASSGYTLDENTKAYVATNVEAQGESDVVVLNEIDAVPAETAVLLKTTYETQEGYSMTLTKASNVPTPDIINKLKRAGAATNTQVYRLGANDAGVGFFAYTKEAAKPDVVVLDVDASNAGARGLTIAFADDEATAIHNVNDNVNLNKVVFDLQGRRVLEPGKGLYIVNGKKVVIK